MKYKENFLDWKKMNWFSFWFFKKWPTRNGLFNNVLDDFSAGKKVDYGGSAPTIRP